MDCLLAQTRSDVKGSYEKFVLAFEMLHLLTAQIPTKKLRTAQHFD